MSHTMTETELPSPSSTTSSSEELSPHRSHERGTYKKSNKPMMEKKRRARINSCLSQIKSLVLQAMKKDNSQYSKLEKADILELTVRHLRNVQRYQNNALVPLPDAMTKYRAGFNECASEVVRYLAESQGVNDEARTRIISHLASILTPINSLQLHHSQTQILPAPLQHVKQEPLDPPQQKLSLPQHNPSLFQISSSQPLSSANSNSQSVMSYQAFLSTPGNTINTSQPTPLSPTAFQCPVNSGVNAPVGIQIPCLATAGFSPSTTQLQLVPSNLSYGQVAFVLTPQGLPTVNLYTTPHGSSLQVGPEVIPHDQQVGVSNYHLAVMDSQASRSNRHGTTRLHHQKSSSPFLHRPCLEDPQNIAVPTSQSTDLKMNHSSTLRKYFTTNTTAAHTGSDSGSARYSTATTTMDGCVNVVTTTSTWRPW